MATLDEIREVARNVDCRTGCDNDACRIARAALALCDEIETERAVGEVRTIADLPGASRKRDAARRAREEMVL